MAKKTSKLVSTPDVEHAYQKYRRLKQEVDAWQQERGSYWIANLRLNKKLHIYQLLIYLKMLLSSFGRD
jgi:hypothetical protein